MDGIIDVRYAESADPRATHIQPKSFKETKGVWREFAEARTRDTDDGRDAGCDATRQPSHHSVACWLILSMHDFHPLEIDFRKDGPPG